MKTGENTEGLDPSFFDGRLLVEIDAWDADLHVGLSTDAMPQEYRIQGGLSISRGFRIDGRIIAPKTLRTKSIRIWLSPFGPDMQFGPDELDEVGQVYIHTHRPQKPDFSATLLIPEASLPVVAICLSSIWKYVHVFTFDEDAERASVNAFGFDAKLHNNVIAWVERE